jgi:hypothetical protein
MLNFNSFSQTICLCLFCHRSLTQTHSHTARFDEAHEALAAETLAPAQRAAAAAARIPLLRARFSNKPLRCRWRAENRLYLILQQLHVIYDPLFVSSLGAFFFPPLDVDLRCVGRRLTLCVCRVSHL